MTVRELIAVLQKLPQDLDVRVWDEPEDDYVPVTGAIKESGCPYVDLLTDEGAYAQHHGGIGGELVAPEEDESPSSRVSADEDAKEKGE